MSLFSPSKKILPVAVGVSGISGFLLVRNFGGKEAPITSSETPAPTPIKAKGRSIGDAIKESNKRLLSKSSSNNAWEVKRRQYQTKFNKFLTKEGLENWCNRSLNSDYQESLFQDISQICSVPSMLEKFKMQNKIVIDLTKSGDQRWAQKVKDYVNSRNKMPNSELKDTFQGVTPEVIMNWCKGRVEEEFLDENDRYRLVETWCVSK